MHSMQKNRALLLKSLEEYVEIHGHYGSYSAILEELLNDNKCSLRKAVNRALLHHSPHTKQNCYHMCSWLCHKYITELNNDKFKNKHKEENNENIQK